jgi:hypothetical protein
MPLAGCVDVAGAVTTARLARAVHLLGSFISCIAAIDCVILRAACLATARLRCSSRVLYRPSIKGPLYQALQLG